MANNFVGGVCFDNGLFFFTPLKSYYTIQKAFAASSEQSALHFGFPFLTMMRSFRTSIINLLGLYLIFSEVYSGFCSDTGEFDLLKFSKITFFKTH